MVICERIEKNGHQCTQSAIAGSHYCSLHGFCIGKTKSGQPCMLPVCPGSTFCIGHDPKTWFKEKKRSTEDQSPVLHDKIEESLKYFQLPKQTTYDTIKKRYRELALKYHPDKGGDLKIFQEIQEHYLILANKYK